MNDTRNERDESALVFVHGIVGFGALRLPGFTIQYFRRLGQELASGLSLYFPHTPPASIAERAAVLARTLKELPHERIYLVAHSMGGLDCRYLIHHLDHERRIRGLATVGTPHRGTQAAEWILSRDGLLSWVGRRLFKEGLMDLTPEACQRFNELIPDRSDVRYLSYAGARPPQEVPIWFRRSASQLELVAGGNDGLVAASSANWGDFRGTVRADHTELVGWSLAAANRAQGRPFDHLSFYRQVIKELAEF